MIAVKRTALVRLSENGADGVENRVIHALSLFERAIGEGYDSGAVYTLGVLLENDAAGEEMNVACALSLNERAIGEGINYNVL